MVTATKRRTVKKAAPKKNVSASYNKFKAYKGKRFYTGMQVGRSHKWYYDQGEWKETKVTPDLWRIRYAVTKRRAGKAPKGSGAKVGTAYHWYIVAHQRVKKLNENDYSTELTGLKYKVAHQRADTGKWSAHTPTQRAHLVKFLKEWIRQLEEEVIPLQFEYDGTGYKGEAVPVPGACDEGICLQLEIMLNDEAMGIIRSAGKSGWKMEGVDDAKLVNAIGDAVTAYYDGET